MQMLGSTGLRIITTEAGRFDRVIRIQKPGPEVPIEDVRRGLALYAVSELIPRGTRINDHDERLCGSREIMFFDLDRQDWGFIRFVLRILQLRTELEAKFYGELHLAGVTRKECDNLDSVARRVHRVVPWRPVDRTQDVIILLPAHDTEELKWIINHAPLVMGALHARTIRTFDKEIRRRFFMDITTDQPPDVFTGPPAPLPPVL